MNPRLPILYSFRRCPFAMRARLALHASHQPYVLREVSLKDKPAEMLALSPKGTVPVLVLPDGHVIDESLDIMLWALGGQDPEGWLYDFDNDLIRRCDTEFKDHLDRYKYATRFPGVDPLQHRDAGAAFLAGLDKRLTGRENLMGQRCSVTDAAILPFVRQFALADWAWFYAQPFPRVHAWLEKFLDGECFLDVMQKFPPWTAGEDGVVMNAA